MADVDHKDIIFAYMHAPAAIEFGGDPKTGFAPPKGGYMYFHSPSGTLWKATGISAGQVEIVGYDKAFKIVPKTVSYQLDGDAFDYKRDVLLFINSANQVTVTVPNDSAVEFPIGFRLPVYQIGLGGVTFEAATGVTLEAAVFPEIGTQFNFGTLIKTGVNAWYFLPNGVGGGGNFDSILTDPITGLVLVDPITGHVLTSPN